MIFQNEVEGLKHIQINWSLERVLMQWACITLKKGGFFKIVKVKRLGQNLPKWLLIILDHTKDDLQDQVVFNSRAWYVVIMFFEGLLNDIFICLKRCVFRITINSKIKRQQKYLFWKGKFGDCNNFRKIH